MKSMSGRLGKRLLLAAAVLNGMLTSCVADLVESSSASRCDFGEVCCSPASALTDAIAKKGHTTQRINLEQGYDLSTKDGAKKGLEWTKQAKPRKLWCSTECKYFSLMQNLAPEWKREPKKWQNYLRSRQRARKLNGHVVEMALQTLRTGGDIYWEWPLGCTGWTTPELDKLRREAEKLLGRPLVRVRIDACMVGLKDEHGMLIGKPWGILTSDQRFPKYMSMRCSKDHPHRVLEGTGLVARSA